MEETTLVVTGLGAVTPVGIGVQEYWDGIVSSRNGITPIERFDTTDLPVRFAGQVRGFDADALIPRGVARNMTTFCQYAYVAACEALRDAGLDTEGGFAPDRTGIVMGTAMDGMQLVAEVEAELATGLLHKVGPRFVPMTLGNIAPGLLAIDKGLHGPCMTLNTACSSGGDAVMTAAMILRSGEADAMVVMGGESIIHPIFISSLAQAKALSRNNEDHEHACRPFDLHRDGFVLGEGGGAIVIETKEHAESRGVESYAVLAGYGNTQDGHHVTAPDPEGTGAARCMHMALRRAGLTPSDVDYVNAHGTSTIAGDKVEAKAIHAVFGSHSPAVSSTKSATGHMMGAGGITEIIACIKGLQEGILPPTINYETPDPDCDLDIVANVARKAVIRVAMSNSLGFGGQNSSIIVTRDAWNRR